MISYGVDRTFPDGIEVLGDRANGGRWGLLPGGALLHGGLLFVALLIGGLGWAGGQAVYGQDPGADRPPSMLRRWWSGEFDVMPVRVPKNRVTFGPIFRTGPAGLRGFEWNFGSGNDLDSDRWPDGWTRREGPRYPRYVDIRIVPHDEQAELANQRLDAWLLLQPGVIPAWQWMRKYTPVAWILHPQLSRPSLWTMQARLHPVLPMLPPNLFGQSSNRYLRVTLDGGLAETSSMRVPTSQAFQYHFACRLTTRGLKHDSAHAELVFLDQQDKEIKTYATRSIGGTSPWTDVSIDKVSAPPEASHMLVRLRVDGSDDGLEDIRGEIGIDDITIEPYPQIQITTDRRRGIYNVDQNITVATRVLGLENPRFRVLLKLTDHQGRQIASTHLTPAVDKPSEAPAASDQQRTRATGPAANPTKSNDLIWELPRLDVGFYRIAASLEDDRTNSLATEITVGVIDRLVDTPPAGPFGWTMADRHPDRSSMSSWSPDETVRWLSSLGVAWVKYPAWLDPDDLAGIDQVGLLFRKLQDANIQVVGMLDTPPKTQLSRYDLRSPGEQVAAVLFRDAAVWQPLLEPVMSRLTLKCNQWQIGGESDDSFLRRPGLQESIADISQGLQGFGQPLAVALPWPWMEPMRQDEASKASWQAVCRNVSPPLSADELDQALLSPKDKSKRKSDVATWLILDPIDRDHYPLDDRIADLVLRMSTARKHSVQAAFVSNPTDPRTGLLTDQGRPDELLLPWRTTATLLGDLGYLGSVDLPGKTNNLIFAGSRRSVMVVWSARSQDEWIYLGEDVRQVDVWGQTSPLPTAIVNGHPMHRIRSGPVPTFLVNVDPTLMAFRMSVEVTPQRLDSLLGKTQRLEVRFTNPTRVNLIGQLTLSGPEAWRVDSPRRSIDMPPRRSMTETFELVLGNAATVGSYEIPLRFEFQTSPPRTITIYRTIQIGSPEIDLKTSTKMNGSDMLVTLEFTNNGTQRRTYQCILFPRGGRQDKRMIATILPGQTLKRYFTLADAEELVGQTMWLRAIQQDADRILNYQVVGRR